MHAHKFPSLNSELTIWNAKLALGSLWCKPKVSGRRTARRYKGKTTQKSKGLSMQGVVDRSNPSSPRIGEINGERHPCARGAAS
jgi:hypothetical protein